METSFTGRRRVLFLDDDVRFLELMERLAANFSRGEWEIHIAENAAGALAIIESVSPHLVVIDVQMSVVDGLQFLTLINRRYPQIVKVVVTGYATEAYRVACLSNGAELFLEKPRTAEGQQSLFAALKELLKIQPEEGFRGVLRRVGLTDVIQMECLGMKSSVLEISGPRHRGRVFIRDGAIIHAEAGDRQGEEALNFLLTLSGGEFRLAPFSPPPRESISGQWEFLLMEAARVRDESQGMGEVITDNSADNNPSVLDELLQAPAEVSASAAVEVSTRRIHEVFLCSAQGEVLYEWRVRNPELWVNFFEFLSQKAQRLGQLLPIGRMERLEMTEGADRLAVVLADDRGLLVRCREEAPSE
jgi:CheY-like chemotaxis protein